MAPTAEPGPDGDAERFDAALRELDVALSTDSDPTTSLDGALAQLTRVAAAALGVDGCSVWIADGDQPTLLRCAADSACAPVERGVLDLVSVPAFHAALDAARCLPVEQVLGDPASAELSESRLVRAGTSALLCAAVRRGEALDGVVVCEQPAGPRGWRAAERHLVAALADRVALWLEATARRRAELFVATRDAEQLARELLYDELTSLPRGTLFLDRLGRALRRTLRDPDALFGVLVLDLAGLNQVDSEHGRAAGDRLLFELARRLECSIRPADSAARVDGDVFAVLVDGLKAPTDANRVAHRIRGELGRPYTISGRRVNVSVAVGIALSTSGYDQPEDMLRDADRAATHASAEGVATLVADETLGLAAGVELGLEDELRQAFERREFHVHYEPIVDMRRGCLAGFRALVRWHHPERGLLDPDVAREGSEDGLGRLLGHWALTRACQDAARWGAEGHVCRLSFPVGEGHLKQADFIAQVESALAETGLARNALHLSLSEVTLMTPTGRARLSELGGLGLRVEVDRFGRGYASLAQIFESAIDTLRLDPSLLRGVDTLALLNTLCGMARGLGLELVADGISTQAQADVLTELGCRFGQGEHYGGPVDREAADLLVRSGRPR